MLDGRIDDNVADIFVGSSKAQLAVQYGWADAALSGVMLATLIAACMVAMV